MCNAAVPCLYMRTSRIPTFVETSIISFAYLHACSIFNIRLIMIMTDFGRSKAWFHQPMNVKSWYPWR
jgi:hypothetical protein